MPGERIVFQWRFVGPDRTVDPTHDSLLTITLGDAPDGGTTLVLVHERLEGLAGEMPDVAGNVEPGRQGALDRLADAVAVHE